MPVTEFKLLGEHAQDLADGRMLGPGETVKLDDAAKREPHNAALIEARTLITVQKGESK